MSRYIVDLASRSRCSRRCPGARALAWLCRQHVNVPTGFVLTTTAFQDFLAAGLLELAHDRPGLNADDPDALRGVIEAAHLPPAIGQAIVQAYRRLGGSVAVRSSLVGEDAASASFAGQFSTQLLVDGDEALLSAIRACWASLFAGRAVEYLVQKQASATSGSRNTTRPWPWSCSGWSRLPPQVWHSAPILSRAKYA